MSEVNTNVPKLRFPEFRDSESWITRPLGGIGRNLDYKRVPITGKDRIKGSIPYYGASGVIDYVQDFIFDEHLLCISEDGANLVARVYPIAFSISGKTWVNNHAHVLKFENNFIQIIIENYLNNINLEDFLTGMAQPKLNRAKLDSIPIPLPDKAEQKKIADCLSSIDELITTQSQKVETLKTHKKGLMQQLFPSEGETVPKLRFPEFQDSGEWVSEKLGNCLSRHPEYGINAPAVPYNDKLPTYLRITDISVDGLFLQNKKSSVAKKVNEENYLYDGDIVLARTGASVGKSYKYKQKDGELVFAGFLIRVRPDKEKLNTELLFQFLSTEQYWRWVDFSSARSGQPGINGNEYASLPISLPPTLKEQQKIANCLSSLDELITTQSQKVELLKTHKKGLMQQLFPANEEVNA